MAEDEREVRATKERKILIFGASGAIGGAIKNIFKEREWQVVCATRNAEGDAKSADEWVFFDPFGEVDKAVLRSSGPYDAVCWAQGANVNDNVYTVDPGSHMEIYRANSLFLVVTLKLLLSERLLGRNARLCVISSIWQNLARQDKLSYCMSKAALQGFVLSAAADIAADGHVINAVLPGALETPMTARTLGPQQVESIRNSTKFGRLPSLEDVANLVAFLCSDDNTGVTGQFIEVDLGFSHVRLI